METDNHGKKYVINREESLIFLHLSSKETDFAARAAVWVWKLEKCFNLNLFWAILEEDEEGNKVQLRGIKTGL
jgi:hypothetical protein